MDHVAHMSPYPAPSGNPYTTQASASPFLPSGSQNEFNPFNGAQTLVPTGVLVPSHQSQSPPSQYQPSQYQSSQYQPSEYQPSHSHSQSYSQSQLPSHYQPHLPPGEHVDPISPYGYQVASHSERRSAEQSTVRDSMSTTQRKAAMAGVGGYKPARFIMHTDVEDALPPPEEESVIELPPLYSERRGPAPGLSASTGADPFQHSPQPATTGSSYPSSS